MLRLSRRGGVPVFNRPQQSPETSTNLPDRVTPARPPDPRLAAPDRCESTRLGRPGGHDHRLAADAVTILQRQSADVPPLDNDLARLAEDPGNSGSRSRTPFTQAL